MFKLILFLITAAIAFLGASKISAQSQQPNSDHEKAAFAIRRLWSPDEEERKQARAEIIRLSGKAIPGLLALLEDINENPSTPRFATGREDEGKRLWERFLSSPQEVADVIHDIEITPRLQDDIIEILGDLRANDAIPILIEIMECRIKTNWVRQRTEPEMIALGKIGEPAVPALIKLIEETEKKAVFVESENPQITKEEWAIFTRSSRIAIQTRAIIVLGIIGDKNALPTLEKLLEQSQDPNKASADIRYIQAAITKIKEIKK